ncbi:MAG: restriction endonuclease subunit S [Acidimicrobiaceae bacterium]|nr:restriction endonuclease subunit S [Chloroflexota bacterium]MCY3948451.1 restriction endonuclease subunit S [Acidimicrobiaceae bacterium]
MRQSYAAYRNSAVDWVGRIPEHWQIMDLGRIGSFFKGGGGTKADETEEGHPCVRYGDLYTRHDFHIRESRSRINPDRAAVYTQIQYGDLLLAGSGETLEEIGKSAANLLREPAFCGGDVVICRPEVEIDATFLGYAADCAPSRHQKSGMGRGVTVMHIYSSELKKLTIAVPPLEEQAQIGAFLDSETARIDKLISMQELLSERLDEYRTALITRVLTKGLPPEAAEVAGLDPAPHLKDSGVAWLGEVPQHWRLHRLKHIATYRTSNVDKKSVDSELPVRLCNYTDVYYRGSIRASDGEFMRAIATPREIARFKLRRGDVLITKDSEDWRDIAVPALVVESADDFVCGYHVGIVRPSLPLDARFAYRAMQSEAVNRQLQISASGVTRYGLLNASVENGRFAF